MSDQSPYFVQIGDGDKRPWRVCMREVSFSWRVISCWETEQQAKDAKSKYEREAEAYKKPVGGSHVDDSSSSVQPGSGASFKVTDIRVGDELISDFEVWDVLYIGERRWGHVPMNVKVHYATDVADCRCTGVAGLITHASRTSWDVSRGLEQYNITQVYRNGELLWKSKDTPALKATNEATSPRITNLGGGE